MIGLSEIRLVEDFSCEGALELNLRAENTRNSRTFVQYVNLVVTWPNEWLSGEFRGKVVIYWSSEGNGYWSEQFSSGEFHVNHGKVYISNFLAGACELFCKIADSH